MDFDEIFEFIVKNYGWVCLIMVAFVCLLLEAIKVPLKKLTSKITNVYVRKIVNKMFIAMAFGISFLLYYVGSLVLPKYIKYDDLQCLITGAFSNVLYALSEGLISSNKAKILSEAVKGVADDGKVTNDEILSINKLANSKDESDEDSKSALEKWQEEMKK